MADSQGGADAATIELTYSTTTSISERSSARSADRVHNPGITEWIQAIVQKNDWVRDHEYRQRKSPLADEVWLQLIGAVKECVDAFTKVCGRPVFVVERAGIQKLQCCEIAEYNPDRVIFKMVYNETANCIEVGIADTDRNKHLFLLLDERNDVCLFFGQTVITTEAAARVLLAPVLFNVEVFVPGQDDLVGPTTVAPICKT